MDTNSRELNAEELNAVVGGGLVDNVLPETEAAVDALVKKMAENSQKFSAFINSPAPETPALPPVG